MLDPGVFADSQLQVSKYIIFCCTLLYTILVERVLSLLLVKLVRDHLWH